MDSSLPDLQNKETKQQENQEQQTPQQQIDPSQSWFNSSQHQQNPQHSDQNIAPQQVIGPQKPPETTEPPLPAGVESGDAATEPLGEGQIQIQHQQIAYYPQNVTGLGGNQHNFGFPGLNPAAAAAALLQLTQFAGNIGDVERAMMELQGIIAAGGYGALMGGGGPIQYAPIGQPPHRGGGRRGVDQYRRGGRRNFGNRGRGRWTPRHYSQQIASAAYPGNLAAEATKSVEEVAEASADNVDQAAQAGMPNQASVQPNVTSAPQYHMQVPRCELCMVDCQTLGILEQHKGGKKHKKNLRKLEAQKAYQPGSKLQSNGQDCTNSNTEGKLHLEYMQNGEGNKQTIPENIPSEAVPVENNTENQPQNPVGEMSYMQASQPGIHQFDNQTLGMKRKIKGGRGGKRMKTFGAPRWPKEPKVVIPLICDLCNVKCDTQEVFDRHLSGKKHISKYKRFEGHQAMYGPEGLQVLYPPNPITQTLSQPQDHQQNFSGPQCSNLLPPSAQTAPPIHPRGAPSQASDGNPDHQQNFSGPQGSSLFPPGAHTAPRIYPAGTPCQSSDGNPGIDVYGGHQQSASIPRS